jgi:glycosyltransferase involved in cell wall biosynthesis
MIGQKSIPGISGGVEKHVEEVSKRLAERGYDITCYNRSHYVEINGSEWNGVHLKYVWAPALKGAEALIYSFLASIRCMLGKYDVVHYHALGPAAMSFLPKLTGKKVVVTVHGLDWQREKWGALAKKYLKLGEMVSALFSDRLITVSENILKYYCKKYGVWQKTCCLPNGVSAISYREADLITENYGIEKDSYILFLARLVPEKGCHYLIQAFNKVAAMKEMGTVLVIAGGSDHTDNYVNMLKSSAGEGIIFTGEVKGSIIDELYSNALFYILPSDVEGMPISLLEAMSTGLCPLVSNIKENMEIIGENSSSGYYFESGNPDSLMKMIEYMLDNIKEVKERGVKAKANVLDNYSWNKATDGLEEVYNSY